MAASVTVYQIASRKRSEIVAQAMLRGIRAINSNAARLRNSMEFREPDSDIAVFYGFDQKMQEIFHAYRARGLTVVYIDLGYFGRLEGGKWAGYHKVSINARHPTAYFQSRRHDPDRVQRFNLEFPNWKQRGEHVLICGTSDKGALVDGFKPQQWETETINLLRKVTQRKLIYRPKPSWAGATPIPGAEFHQSKDGVERWLKDCHAVVSHHSNVCVDAFLAGVPNFCVEGVGLPLSETDFARIEHPKRPGGRQQWAQDLAYCQFSIVEMQEGVCWRTLKDEGHIPQ